MLNGVDVLVMMKTDVLNPFKTLRVCTGYEQHGKIMEDFPFDLGSQDFTPVYQDLKGWKTDLEVVTSIQDVPREFNDYIKFIEKAAGLPVHMVSIGPDRTQTLTTGKL